MPLPWWAGLPLVEEDPSIIVSENGSIFEISNLKATNYEHNLFEKKMPLFLIAAQPIPQW